MHLRCVFQTLTSNEERVPEFVTVYVKDCRRCRQILCRICHPKSHHERRGCGFGEGQGPCHEILGAIFCFVLMEEMCWEKFQNQENLTIIFFSHWSFTEFQRKYSRKHWHKSPMLTSTSVPSGDNDNTTIIARIWGAPVSAVRPIKLAALANTASLVRKHPRSVLFPHVLGPREPRGRCSVTFCQSSTSACNYFLPEKSVVNFRSFVFHWKHLQSAFYVVKETFFLRKFVHNWPRIVSSPAVLAISKNFGGPMVSPSVDGGLIKSIVTRAGGLARSKDFSLPGAQGSILNHVICCSYILSQTRSHHKGVDALRANPANLQDAARFFPKQKYFS